MAIAFYMPETLGSLLNHMKWEKLLRLITIKLPAFSAAICF